MIVPFEARAEKLACTAWWKTLAFYAMVEDSGVYALVEDSGVYALVEDSGVYAVVEERRFSAASRLASRAGL